MILKFPALGGGPVQGLNDAGVENFEGAIDLYVSRECGQNSGDAVRPDSSKARLEFQRLMVPASSIPGLPSLRTVLASCLDKWGGKAKEREFFEAAIGLAASDLIPVLKISDYGTTGLTGSDTEETGRWFALVKSQGVSNKENTAGGSFGIGKSSPFAASRFRTVFYGSRTLAGEVALQGVCRLVTHKNAGGQLTQGVGFIGDYDPTGGEGGGPIFRAIRDPDRIPTMFRRTEPGTDIWVVGYRSGSEWKDNLLRSILNNFWPAIHRGSIEFQVGEQSITKDNLDSLIQRFVGSDDFDTHQYFRSVTSTPVKRTLRTVGKCSLYLTTASPDLPKKICMARRSGMRIYDYAPRACRVPFSGLFICDDPDGNTLLRKLEPPKHDAWDQRRTEDGSGKKALDEIKMWIREEVKKLNPLFGGKSFNESELAKYLPDISPEDDLEPIDHTSDSGPGETLEPRPRPGAPQPSPVRARMVVREGTGSSDGGTGNEPEEGHPPHGFGTGGRGKNRGGGAGAEREPPTLSVRAFMVGVNAYRLVIRSPAAFSGKLMVKAVGEDGAKETVTVMRARLEADSRTEFDVDGGRIDGVRLEADLPTSLVITLAAVGRRALSVEALL